MTRRAALAAFFALLCIPLLAQSFGSTPISPTPAEIWANKFIPRRANLWLEYTLDNYVPGNSGTPAIWYDSSGNGRHASQSIVASMPQKCVDGVQFTTANKQCLELPVNCFSGISTCSAIVAVFDYDASVSAPYAFFTGNKYAATTAGSATFAMTPLWPFNNKPGVCFTNPSGTLVHQTPITYNYCGKGWKLMAASGELYGGINRCIYTITGYNVTGYGSYITVPTVLSGVSSFDLGRDAVYPYLGVYWIAGGTAAFQTVRIRTLRVYDFPGETVPHMYGDTIAGASREAFEK